MKKDVLTELIREVSKDSIYVVKNTIAFDLSRIYERLNFLEDALGKKWCGDCGENHLDRIDHLDDCCDECSDSDYEDELFSELFDRIEKVEELTSANKFHYETKKELIPNDDTLGGAI